MWTTLLQSSLAASKADPASRFMQLATLRRGNDGPGPVSSFFPLPLPSHHTTQQQSEHPGHSQPHGGVPAFLRGWIFAGLHHGRAHRESPTAARGSPGGAVLVHCAHSRAVPSVGNGGPVVAGRLCWPLALSGVCPARGRVPVHVGQGAATAVPRETTAGGGGVRWDPFFSFSVSALFFFFLSAFALW